MAYERNVRARAHVRCSALNPLRKNGRFKIARSKYEINGAKMSGVRCHLLKRIPFAASTTTTYGAINEIKNSQYIETPIRVLDLVCARLMRCDATFSSFLFKKKNSNHMHAQCTLIITPLLRFGISVGLMAFLMFVLGDWTIDMAQYVLFPAVSLLLSKSLIRV